MTEKRIQINNVLQNQLPSYVREEFPLVAEFLKQYYISQEFQGAPADLIQNIDQYIKLDTIKRQEESTLLSSDVSFLDETINVQSTIGFPDYYGLIQIDNEIITYTGKTENSFLGCARGFSGTTSYNDENRPDHLVFETSLSEDHTSGSEVKNLSSLFLAEFFNKIKYQLTPGFENRDFYTGLDKYLFIKQSKDFYSTRGTDNSFKILFKVLYGEDVSVIKPRDLLVRPSDAQYQVTNDLVVESISGDPTDLINSTLFQDEYGSISSGYTAISDVEKIVSKNGRVYYKLSFDGGYNRDIRVDGSLYGNLSIHPKTKIIGDVSQSSTTIDVDSTIGFPNQGEIAVVYDDGTEGVITYSSKNLNQFHDCQNIEKTVKDSTEISLNVYAYGTSNKDRNETIKVKINPVLSNVTFDSDSYYYKKGERAIIRSLGLNPKDSNVYNSWFFNNSIVIESSTLQLIDITDNTYLLTTIIAHNFKIGDKLNLVSSIGSESETKVISVVSENSVKISGQGVLDTTKKYTVRKLILKAESEVYSNINTEIANIQNAYADGDKVLVSTPSLPHYSDLPLKSSARSITFSGTFVGDSFQITTNRDHGFYTGESVYYTSSNGSLFEDGLYFIQRINASTVRFAKSRSNIYNSIFVSLDNPVTVSNSTIEDYEKYSLELQSQKLLRELRPPINDGGEYVTDPGSTGILINGVEILNYKSKDRIYYGPLEDIEVNSTGADYDVINPPTLVISDSVGTGATGYCSVNGSLRAIRIIDPGFDYLETPKIKISGGNGIGAKAFASLKLVDHKVYFNAEPQSSQVDTSNNSIGFTTYHKFRYGERVVYRTDSQEGVGGISTNSSYFVSTVDEYTIKFHNTYSDALSGINTISLTSFGVGNQYIESYNKKSVINSINVQSGGVNYQNKKRTAIASGITTSIENIEIKNHDFNSGEIVKYSTTGSSIGGLTAGENYYVTKVDDNKFRLSLVGIETGNKDFYYRNKQYINLTSTGSGVHSFNYPEISVEVVGRVGISSINGETFSAKVQPIFRGEITSVHLEENGVGYGSSEVLNFNRNPQVNLNIGSGCKLIPIINGGKLEQVLINNPGSGYIAPPDLAIRTESEGVGAVITPVLENGTITSVKIIESGIGYDPKNTFIEAISPGSGADLQPKIKSWTVNLFQKNLSSIKRDDGFIFKNSISRYGLQYGHVYAPRKLRESIYAVELGGDILYGKTDLRIFNNSEVSSTDHSPIIGWAYDGNPIYGPYGYSKKDGGIVTRLNSGYSLNPLSDRPPFPNGFFIEDYEYNNNDDDTVLDEHNGRFCITPDFPNGTYAYFATIDSSSSLSFGGYRLPAFPYLIGNTFKSKPNEFNFDDNSNQDDYDLNSSNWIRNTKHYNLFKNSASYPYFNLPNDLNQTVDIKYASPGSVEDIKIISGGSQYKVNDRIIFNDNDTRGFGLSSKVSRVSGKNVNSISVASTTVYNVEIYPQEGNSGLFFIESDSPHGINNKDLVTLSGLNTSSILDRSFYSAGVTTNTFSISSPSGVGTVGLTGIVTYFSVSGNIAYSNVKENDIFSIGSERVKVLGVDRPSSRIRVLRSIDGTVGTAHSYSDVLYEVPRRISINVGKSTSFAYKPNKEIYFDPAEAVGLGSISGVGIGSTLVFSNPGVGITEITIPTKTIYLPKHNLNTGDSLLYSTYSGDGILISSDGISTSVLTDQSTVYVAKVSDDLIGISTVKVGLGSTGTFVGVTSLTANTGTLYFLGIGTGNYHSFKTEYPKVSGNVSRSTVTVSTAQTHGLINNDYVFVNVSPNTTENYVIKYNDYNRKVLINPKDFSAVGVNTVTNTITINDHNFKNGQKVLYTSASPSLGLLNNGEYYIIVFDKDNVRLSELYIKDPSFIPQIVDINSADDGTLSLINPPLNAYKNSTLSFDVSDTSLSYFKDSATYSAFELNFYSDSNYTQLFDKSEDGSTFEVKRSGRVGIDSTAKVTLDISANIPQKLYYRLDPVYKNVLPEVKETTSVDDTVFSNNEISVVESDYSGKHQITSIASTSFTYVLLRNPESSSYDPTISTVNYETNSSNAFGGITKIDIENKGQNYYSLPEFSTVRTSSGSGAILEPVSKTIGRIEKTNISDIGFDFSSDFTIRPSLAFPQIVKIDSLSSFDSIGITSVGRGYNTTPKLIVLDGETQEIIPEVDLRYSIGDTKVTILNNTYRLNPVTPKIIPTENPNGVGIGTIIYNSTTKDVSVILSVGFSTGNTFPFSVNDKIMVENVSIGIGSTAKGYNSQNYNYQLFTITSVDENIGGIGSITYNLSNFLNSGEEPGTYDPINSAGRIIPEKYFPVFDISLKNNDFLVGENVKYEDSQEILGVVESWDNKVNNLKILTRDYVESDRVLQGLSSKSNGIISSVTEFNGFIDVGPYSKVKNGWITDTGVLNNDLQRVQDNFYYQNFSYSLKSKVSYETWEDAVGSLNHTAGFKKFSDYQCEPSISEVEGNQLSVGISTSIIDITADIVGFGNLNCVYDFDLVRENSLRIENRVLSNEVDFTSRVLTDYFESVGNRVLTIDDFSSTFNSYPRPTRFSDINRFALADARALKYITYVKDKRYIGQRQLMLVTLIHDNFIGYINQYARLETSYDLGSFDFIVDGNDGVLRFYPVKYSVNDYYVSVLSNNLKENFSGIGSTTLGGLVDLKTNTTYVSSGSTTIVSLGTTYTSGKILVEISSNTGEYQFDELSFIHNGTDIEFIDYGQLSTESSSGYASSGFGTYNAYITGSNVNIDFTPNIGIAASISTLQVAISDSSVSGVGTFDMKYAKFGARSTSIASSTSPISSVIGEYPNEYDGGYFIVQVSDTTNNYHQLSEVILIDDDSETYLTEFANIETNSGLGTVGAVKSVDGTQLLFTPIANIDAEVKVYFNSLRSIDDTRDNVSYNNGTFTTGYGDYFGTDIDIRRAFDITHKNYPVFERLFNGSNSSIVDINENTIKLPNHFFVSGELITYSSGSETTINEPIGIVTTYFGVGIGTTDKLPSSVYIIKVDSNTIKLAKSAEDALKTVPVEIDFVSVGIGSEHTITSTNQNAKVLVTIDNVIQSPIVSTDIVTGLSTSALSSEDIIYVDSITNLFGGDLLKIDNEIMRISGVGIGSTNSVSVIRPWMGTESVGHSTGTTVTKVIGNYNIVDNTINFVSAPYGNVPLSSTTNPPDERDWIGISTGSSFQGRVFLKNGTRETTEETYYKNYIFDDISSGFNGIGKTFTLTSEGLNITGISSDNAIVLINDIFQPPGLTNSYTLDEDAGITSISFVGAATSLASDINTSTLPVGGLIVSVGSTEGFGYQPLISAGGTAIVSTAGTIASISIGNSGSGYRSGIQTATGIEPVVVRVAVATSSTGTPNIEFIGTAAVNNGNIVSIAITNPGVGYTSTNPPYVIIDDPLSYSNIPLVYSSSSSGIGTQSTIDIVVGQGSSVIDFTINNVGYGYTVGDVLTIPIGGIAGIPTTSSPSFKEFEVRVDRIFNDKFTGWSVGEIQIFDNIEYLFDDQRLIFPLYYQGQIVSVLTEKGSNITIQDTLLVFVNDILQVPGEGYVFNGGSAIEFTEAPKIGDTCKILFYKGNGDVDVIFRNILETVKIGDDIILTYDSLLGQPATLLENPRTVLDIKSTNLVDTNPYYGPGNTTDPTLRRPVIWCKQTEDKIINEQEISKDRTLYEPSIYPAAYIIQSVGVGSTTVYVDNLRPFFDPQNENDIELDFQNNITIISQENKVGASATATVSSTGEVISVTITDGGFGYTSTPVVVFETPVGLGTTQRASGIASVSSGVVTSISISFGGTEYSQPNPPKVLIETPSANYESDAVTNFVGDSGVIVGFGTTTISSADKVIFDLYIPEDSYLRDSSLVGSAVTLSSLNQDDYFIVYDSNVGFSTDSFYSLDNIGNTIGIATTCIDNIYQVDSASDVLSTITGIGTTIVRRVFARVSGMATVSFGSSTSSFYFGSFSWGKINLSYRSSENQYNAYTNNGISGISSSALIFRSSPLKYKNYII
jgi:hypothetical protein